MDLTEAVVRFAVGGVLITAVSLLGETKYSILSGLAVLFPIVTLTGYYFLSLELPLAELRHVVLFSTIAVPTVWGFTLGFYAASARFSVPVSLAVGVCAWLVVALVVVWVDSRWTGFLAW